MFDFTFDDILSATVSAADSADAPVVLGEQHDLSKINTGSGSGQRTLQRQIDALKSGAYWDEAEYGISREAQIAKLQLANTPEAQARELEEMTQRALRRAGLDATTGRVALMVAGKLPWHGLGVNVAAATTWEHAARLGGLDWLVLKTTLLFRDAQGEQHEAKGRYALVRSDTGRMLDACAQYKPIQNSEAFAFLDEVLGSHGAHYEVAGALFGGEQVFMLARFPQHAFSINGSDRQEAFVAFTNPHTVGKAAKCFGTSVRIECANTHRIACGKDAAKGISIPHTGDVKRKIRAAQEALGITVKQFDVYREGCEAMVSKPMPIKAYANDVLDAVLDITAADAMKGADALAAALNVHEAQRKLMRASFEKKIERRGEILQDILERYESRQNGTNGMRGTAWAAFNAVTDHVDHNRIGRNSSDAETWQSRRFEAALLGKGDDMKQVAFELATAAV
jgi:phage/plasmid-like protein (TIGR03299 family)